MSQDLTDWIGRSETLHDTITPTPVVQMTATLDHPAAPVPGISRASSATAPPGRRTVTSGRRRPSSVSVEVCSVKS